MEFGTGPQNKFKYFIFPLVVQYESKYYQGSVAEMAMQTYKETL